MNYSDKYVEEPVTEAKIENKIHGKLSYYTINQVADLWRRRKLYWYQSTVSLWSS